MAENDEVELAPRIVVSKRVRFGRPVIHGTRVHMVRTATWPIVRHLSTLGPQSS